MSSESSEASLWASLSRLMLLVLRDLPEPPERLVPLRLPEEAAPDLEVPALRLPLRLFLELRPDSFVSDLRRSLKDEALKSGPGLFGESPGLPVLLEVREPKESTDSLVPPVLSRSRRCEEEARFEKEPMESLEGKLSRVWRPPISLEEEAARLRKLPSDSFEEKLSLVLISSLEL